MKNKGAFSSGFGSQVIYTVFTGPDTRHHVSSSISQSLLSFTSHALIQSEESRSLCHGQTVQRGVSGCQRLAERTGAGHAREVPEGAGQLKRIFQEALHRRVEAQEAGGRRGVRDRRWRSCRGGVMLQGGGSAAHQRVQGRGQRMQRQVGRWRCRGDGGMSGRRATLEAGAAVNLPDQLLHLLQGAGQHEDVVASEKQRGDLGKLADRRALSVGHDFPQAVHRLVQVVHPFPLPTVHLQPQVLHLVLAQLRSGLGFAAAPAATLAPALAGLAARSVLSAVSLEHLVGEEAPGRVVHHQVWRGGTAAGGAGVGVHL